MGRPVVVSGSSDHGIGQYETGAQMAAPVATKMLGRLMGGGKDWAALHATEMAEKRSAKAASLGITVGQLAALRGEADRAGKTVAEIVAERQAAGNWPPASIPTGFPVSRGPLNLETASMGGGGMIGAVALGLLAFSMIGGSTAHGISVSRKARRR